MLNSHEAIPIPVSTKRTYVDPTTYASPDEAIEEFAKEIEPKTLRLDAEIGAGMYPTVGNHSLPVWVGVYMYVCALSTIMLTSCLCCPGRCICVSTNMLLIMLTHSLSVCVCPVAVCR